MHSNFFLFLQKRKKSDDDDADVADVEPLPAVEQVAEKPSEEPPCPVQSLPDELLAMIFSHLSPKDLLSCSAVDKRWSKVAFR